MWQLIIVVITIYFIFNPYLAWIWRSDKELWQTREESYGWPYYCTMERNSECIRNFLTATPIKQEVLHDNIIYVE